MYICIYMYIYRYYYIYIYIYIYKVPLVLVYKLTSSCINFNSTFVELKKLIILFL